MTTVTFQLKDVPDIKAGTYDKTGLAAATRLELYLHCALFVDSDCDRLKEILESTSPETLEEIYLNIEYNEAITSVGLAAIFSTLPRFQKLRVLDLFLAGLDNFSNADCQLLADNLQKSTLTHLSRFSFSVLRSVITSEGLATVIEQISKASALQDIHISIMRVSTIDESALVTLADFLDHSRAHLKRFEFSAFWCEKIPADKKGDFKKKVLNDYDNLEFINFDAVKIARPK